MKKNNKAVYIIFGVSGTGKTTIGKLLAEKLEIPFYDADDFHPKENVEKMSNGIPLNDEDRSPWLQTLAKEIEFWSENGGAVLACSALKQSYRNILQTYKKVEWIFLEGEFDLIYNRINQRKGHYMGSDMLQSQFDTLEEPITGIKVSIIPSPKEIVENIISKIN